MIKNILHLFVFQMGNFIIPLLLLPYLLKVLSYEDYQILAVNQAVLMLMIFTVCFGFDLKATRDIANVIEKKLMVAEYILSVYVIKFSIFLILVVGYSLIGYYYFQLDMKIVLATIFYLASFVPINNWYFQAREEFHHLSKVTILPKVVIMPLVFVFIKGTDDGWLYFFFSGVSSFASAIALFNMMMINERKYIAQVKLSWINTMALFQDSIHIFLSQISTTLLNSVNSLILPFWLDPKSFAIFNVMERMIRIIAMLTSPVTNAIFPYLAKRKDKLYIVVNNLLILSTIAFAFCYGVYLWIGKSMLYVAFPNEAGSLFDLMKYTLVIPLFILWNNLFGTQIGLNLGKDKEFSRVILCGGLVNITLMVTLTPKLEILGASTALLLSQAFVLLGMYFIAKKCGYKLLRNYE